MLAFPSNQFGAQATGCNECECAFFAQKLQRPYGSLPCFDKTDVNGPGAPEAYRILKSSATGHDKGYDIMWNYEKFLVDSTGNPVKRYASTASPLEAEEDIRSLLNA